MFNTNVTSAVQILALAAQARDKGDFLPAAYDNLAEWLQPGFLPPWAIQALAQLAANGAWTELNNRFFKKLAFGTGGMRGLTIGEIIADAERGAAKGNDTPAHAAVGANNVNDFTLIRATIGLYRYTAKWLAESAAAAGGVAHQARLVIAHDVRHFSRHFCELAASTWIRLGGEAYIFDDCRSTPQLSFTVRHLCADAGIVITASHNPPQYNGLKCYFFDGAQVIPPHDQRIIDEVNATRLAEIPAFLEKEMRGVKTVPKSAENNYLDRLADNVLDKGIIAENAPTVVYTNLHGAGDVMILPALKRFGANVTKVAKQRPHDPNFSTVKSPNPEERAAFDMGIATARRARADIVIGTDPDDDRVGAAVRGGDGKYSLVTGNVIGSALAAYRITRMKELGIIPPAGSEKVTLLKTFVTTPLQDAIARAEGIRCVNTLTGFKWIGAKLGKYQAAVENALRTANPISAFPKIQPVDPVQSVEPLDGLEPFAAFPPLAPACFGTTSYDALPWRERAELLQRHSKFFIFGGEESYGYLGTDEVRDKDGNAAALMLVELAAWLKKRRITFAEYMDRIYLRCGYFAEDLLNILLLGADGEQRIGAILKSVRTTPPKIVDGTLVTRFQDFGKEDIFDEDGDLVPKEDFFFFTLEDGRSFAIRGSGTEPKIKFYLFAKAKPENARALATEKTRVAASLAALRSWLREEAYARAGLPPPPPEEPVV